MKINWTRVILGGLLAGLVIDMVDMILSGAILSRMWADAMVSLNRSPDMTAGVITAMWVFGFLVGIYAVWLYVNLRPRFGAGPKTAVITGIAVWVPIGLLSMIPPAAMQMFTLQLAAATVLFSLVEIVAGTLAGAAIYKERAVSAAKGA